MVTLLSQKTGASANLTASSASPGALAASAAFSESSKLLAELSASYADVLHHICQTRSNSYAVTELTELASTGAASKTALASAGAKAASSSANGRAEVEDVQQVRVGMAIYAVYRLYRPQTL